MTLAPFIANLATGIGTQNGHALSVLLRVTGDNAQNLLRTVGDTRPTVLSRFKGSIISPWDEIAIAHVRAVVHVEEQNFGDAYAAQRDVVNGFLRYFITTTNWTLPILYTVLTDLRDIAYKVDVAAFNDGKPGLSMEDAARSCNKAFSNCVTDRTSPYEVSRKWGIYHTVGLVLKCYFKARSGYTTALHRVNRIALSRNVMRALKANPDIPPLSAYPRAHQVTYRYYVGMINFLNEEYTQARSAEEELSFAFYNCHTSSTSNLERILTYLIPLRILCGQLPSPEFLDRFPALNELYAPFVDAIRHGRLQDYDLALTEQETRLADLGILLTIEKARDVCLRGLFRRVWSASERSTRIPISSFHAALRISGQEDVPVEEAECLLANMIYKGFMRGYISHERQMVVLAATSPFPLDRKTPFA
ncbi:COP9 signalosome complex subunit 12 [Exidia glandulosa HHB12029]|uniref:COP9 signalosome complex subunit 12 n=1 Tax=Exidia glandulosa HHB12029 TaxID=1314781 RepID=A0A165QW42_EXIGL|nr:COP9 signalosome complex subunit 12 [Exidia glandulosa HHB12029]